MTLPNCLKIECDAPYILIYIYLKTATVYWDYNVFPGYNDKIMYCGNTVKFEGGYRTFAIACSQPEISFKGKPEI